MIHEIVSKPVPDVIKFLELALEEAKSGAITGVLILTQNQNVVRYSQTGIKDRFTTLGLLYHAMHKLLDD